MANKTTNRCEQFKVTRNGNGNNIHTKSKVIIKFNKAKLALVSVIRIFPVLVLERQSEDSNCFLQFEMCCESDDMQSIKICSFSHLFQLIPCRTLL